MRGRRPLLRPHRATGATARPIRSSPPPHTHDHLALVLHEHGEVLEHLRDVVDGPAGRAWVATCRRGGARLPAGPSPAPLFAAHLTSISTSLARLCASEYAACASSDASSMMASARKDAGSRSMRCSRAGARGEGWRVRRRALLLHPPRGSRPRS